MFALGRDVPKTQLVADAINSECNDPARVTVIQCDLSSLVSVRSAAAMILATGVPLSLLLNNAGVMAIVDRRLTSDGFEVQEHVFR